ncbi:MAG: lytic transglycosylase domain-containing protein [Verrucomicrobiia bacterium]
MTFLFKLLSSLLIAFGLAFFLYQREIARTSRYDEWIRQEATLRQIDPYLVKAVIWRETNFNSHYIGSNQERGLMQITPIAAQEWQEKENGESFQLDHLFDPQINITIGTWYLAQALKRWQEWDDPIPFALAEYNAGRANALRWATSTNDIKLTAKDFLNQITFPSTKNYIITTMEKYKTYRNQAKFY